MDIWIRPHEKPIENRPKTVAIVTNIWFAKKNRSRWKICYLKRSMAAMFVKMLTVSLASVWKIVVAIFIGSGALKRLKFEVCCKNFYSKKSIFFMSSKLATYHFCNKQVLFRLGA